MQPLKIAYTSSVQNLFTTDRPLIEAAATDYTDIAAAVVSDKDLDIINGIDETKFGIPIFVFSEEQEEPDDEMNELVYRWVYVKDLNAGIVDNEIEAAAEQYEWRVLPPFFETLSNYMELKNQQFNCPTFTRKY